MNLKGLKKRCLKRKGMVSKKFKKNTWSKKDVNEGGGQYFILKNGQVFDQVGVNFSKVQGNFLKILDQKYREQMKILITGHQEFQLSLT